MFFFPRILNSLPPLPRQHSAAIGVTVHSHCVESFQSLLQRCRRGRGCSKLWKNTIFPEHPVLSNYKHKHYFSCVLFNSIGSFLNSKDGDFGIELATSLGGIKGKISSCYIYLYKMKMMFICMYVFVYILILNKCKFRFSPFSQRDV